MLTALRHGALIPAVGEAPTFEMGDESRQKTTRMDEIWSQVKKQSVLEGLFKFSISLERKLIPKRKEVPKKLKHIWAKIG